MTIFRKKKTEESTFEARQYSGRTSDLESGLITWLGAGTTLKVANYDYLCVSISCGATVTPLQPRDWIVREPSGQSGGEFQRVMTDEAFKAEFESVEGGSLPGGLDIDDMELLEQSTRSVHMQTIHRKPAPTVEELLMQALDTVRAGKARL